MSRNPLIPTLCFASVGLLPCGASAHPACPPDSVNALVEKSVSLRLQDAEEARQWTLRQQELKELISLYEEEYKRNEERITAMEKRMQDLHAELASIRDGIDASRSAVQARLPDLERWERSAASLVRLLPKSERRKLEMRAPVAPTSEGVPASGIAERFRSLAATLNALQVFHSTITQTRELLPVAEDGRMEVRVVYAGLAMAWYVNDDLCLAGYGYPAGDSWKWVSSPEAAQGIALLASGMDNPTDARWTTLPVPAWKEWRP